LAAHIFFKDTTVKLAFEFCKNRNRPIVADNNHVLKIDGKPIRKVNQSKFLGVYIDENISWRPHIQRIITKVSQTIGIIGRAKSFMNEQQLALLYNTMVTSSSVLPH